MIVDSIAEGCEVCLRYFGIFKYPLRADEVYHYTPYPATPEEVQQALDMLVGQQRIYRIGDFYLEKDQTEWIDERHAGYARAMQWLNRSSRFTSIIAGFPFVRAVAISGSLSKYYVSADPDLDFFIITAKDRLWIARSLLHFFKKLTFITGHQHYFCMNYLVDTDALSIEHRNLYSAIEVKTLLPAFNNALVSELLQQNTWTAEYLPNHPGYHDDSYVIGHRRRRLKTWVEALINLLRPGKLNRFFMQLTDRKWRRKWRHAGYSPEEYDRAFRTTLHISKNHPVDYEKKVMDSLPKNRENHG